MPFKYKHIVIAAAVYLFIISAIGTSFPDSGGLLIAVAIAYAAACMLITRMMISSATVRRSTKAIEFSRTGAMDAIGSEWSSFHHVFAYNDDAVISSFRNSLSKALQAVFSCNGLQEITFKDVDHDLTNPESRTFLLTEVFETCRKTRFALLSALTRTGTVQSVRWWILVEGVRDPNRVFWRYALSPLLVPLVILPYYRRQYNPLNGLTTVYPSFFNHVDILALARELQYVAFETLVDVLESFDIDTTDLKQQKGNILNINVTGGQTNFGSVVQGAMNKVSGAMRGGVAA
jgi:hypothetical protein